MNNSLFVVFNNNGIFQGFYTDKDVVNAILKDNMYCGITEDMRNYMINRDCLKFCVNSKN